jgi:hypothetical protein
MTRTKHLCNCLLGWVAFMAFCASGFCAMADGSKQDDPKQIVRLAVKTELDANRNDHSHWLYFEVDRKPKGAVSQWVAETAKGDLRRVVKENARELSAAEQRARMDGFVRDSATQAKERKAGEHDDQQATELLKLLPDAFIWTNTGSQNGNSVLHFKPDPKFRAPDREARVFASMEGDMTVNDAQHRIVSLKGRLIHDVKFGGGLFATLKAGGTFDVERREVGKAEWQITETHVHIEGHALLFRSISEQEDDVKSKFKPLPGDLTLEQAENGLLKEGRPDSGAGQEGGSR